jgi:leucine dehydrogenase
LDVYAPCALGHEFQEKSVGELNCAIIAGGANNQLSNAKVGDRIFQRSILYAPDYVINAGGLIFVSEELESDGFKLSRIERRINSIGTTLEDIFVASEKDQTPTHRVAAQLAEKRIFGGTQ